MLHEKSLLSYLLAVVAMATVGCDDDTVNHDVFTKADGTLNSCGTFDANETIVEKGDVVKNVRVINSERYEYTCAQFDENNSKCLGIERKICKNDNFDDFKCSPRWVTRSVANACSERRPSPRRRQAPPRTQWPPARPRPTATAKR